jgi:hypothetical protein
VAKKIVLDFSKAAPVSKSSKFDRVPEGPYLVKIGVELGETKGDVPKPAVYATLTIAKGPVKGRRVGDIFMIPQTKRDKLFGLQRLHGLMVAAGIKEQHGQVDAGAVVKKLDGREVIAVIRDGEMPAQGDFEARTISRPDEYLSAESKQGKALLNGSGADADDDEDEDVGSSDEDEDEDEDEAPAKKSSKKKASKDDDDDDDDSDDEDEDEEPAPKKKAKAKKAKDDDDEFDDEDED